MRGLDVALGRAINIPELANQANLLNRYQMPTTPSLCGQQSSEDFLPCFERKRTQATLTVSPTITPVFRLIANFHQPISPRQERLQIVMTFGDHACHRAILSHNSACPTAEPAFAAWTPTRIADRRA